MPFPSPLFLKKSIIARLFPCDFVVGRYFLWFIVMSLLMSHHQL
jgi:hypothetical protein